MAFSFVIDDYINKYIPKNQVHKLPKAISFFLGYHDPPHPRVVPLPDHVLWLEILIGSFSGLSLIMGVFINPNVFTDHHHAPMLVASYAASAILCFNTNQVPLAQPRNVFFGHFISSLVGVCISKLFGLSERGRENYWAGGALSVAISSVLMTICNCVHPPAGASAALPCVDLQIRRMSWWYLPVQVVDSLLILSVALVTGNVIRSYPVYWWSPGHKSSITPPPAGEEEEEEKRSSAQESEIDRVPSDMITISIGSIIVPERLYLDETQQDLLKMFQSKLIENAEREQQE
ncbi:hypothetical protein KGF56_002063 [Candida oxycetoniae]|uniref:HPP transmembrane region domain-containing protein n=1 Tax=Candida oxycetoniae TaxID=497107 RepID=A0AAI9WY85_9ASCO|nr:uncharacterized protein KGF56_002063 [Candida oxycetoniae]KAI3405107.2 hypothetical protein KGF56_002063 [Candida oxycetoniae]